MSPVEVLLLLALAAFFAGLGGSYLGIGGGAGPRKTAEPEQRLFRPGRPSGVPVPRRPAGRRVRRERRGRPVLRSTRGRRRLHQSSRDEHPDARADEGRGGDEQLHDRGDRRGERVHLLLARSRRPEPGGDGHHRGLHGDELGHATSRARESRQRSIRLRDLPRGARYRDGGPRPRILGGRMIAARAGIRLVPHRITALRRAGVGEVEDTNRLIYHVLRGGVLVSVSFILFAFILRGFGGPDIPPNSISVRNLVPQLVSFTPAGYLNLGILLMIFTPVARVVLSFLSFAEDRDRTYVAVTAIVLVNLLVSVFLLA